MTPSSFDPIWREKYARGLQVRAPYDCIVSFVHQQQPKKERANIRILEVGCGTGNNIWYLSREGFSLSGIDASPEAIAYASARLAKENLHADLRVGDFTELPYPEDSFDLVYDRGSLTCCGLSFARQAVREVHRVLKTNGKFFFNPYSAEHTSAKNGKLLPDNLTVDIYGGTLVGCGQLCFYSRTQVEELLSEPWQIESLSHLQIRELKGPAVDLHSEWRVVARK